MSSRWIVEGVMSDCAKNTSGAGPLDQVTTELIDVGPDFFAEWGPGGEGDPTDADLIITAMGVLQDLLTKFQPERFGRSKAGPMEFLPARLNGQPGWFLACEIWDESESGQAMLRVFVTPGHLVYDVLDVS